MKINYRTESDIDWENSPMELAENAKKFLSPVGLIIHKQLPPDGMRYKKYKITLEELPND